MKTRKDIVENWLPRYTGEKLGKALGITKAEVSRMENGRMDFKISRLHKIAQIAETDVCKLISAQTIDTKTELKNMVLSENYVFINKEILQQFIEQTKL